MKKHLGGILNNMKNKENVRCCVICNEPLLPEEYKENKVKDAPLLPGMRKPFDDECMVCFAKENDYDADQDLGEHLEFIDSLKQFREKRRLRIN